MLPPKGKVSLQDLCKMYNLIDKPVNNQQLEDIVYRIWDDMVASLCSIEEWFHETGDTASGSDTVRKHLNALYNAKTVDDMIVAIDNCLNEYHGVAGAFLENIVDGELGDIVGFLDEVKSK